MSRELVLITGASSGIGRALALEGAKRGYDLLLIARRAEMLESLKSEISSVDPKCDVTLLTADVTDPEFDTKVPSAFPKGKHLKIAFANAGIGVAGRFEKLKIQDFTRCFDVNVMGVIRTAHAVFPTFLERGGHFAIVGSLSGHIANPLGAPYNASKFAVRGLAETLRAEYSHKGVIVSLISPGPVETEIFNKNNKGEVVSNPLPTWRKMSARTAARRMYDGVLKGKREFSVHWQMSTALYFSRTFPGLTSWIMRKIYAKHEAKFVELLGRVNPDSV